MLIDFKLVVCLYFFCSGIAGMVNNVIDKRKRFILLVGATSNETSKDADPVADTQNNKNAHCLGMLTRALYACKESIKRRGADRS